jgi:hypothetical protein
MSWLYRYETKGIQSWILSSNLLRDLAGGSALIESLTQTARVEAEALGAEIVQATSGAMTAVFNTKASLGKFASEWPMQVAFRTPGIQLIQAWVDETAGFPALFEALTRKRNQLSLVDIEVNPWVLRTGRSGLPAIPKRVYSKARQTKLDSVALAKEHARDEEHYKSGAEVTGARDWNEFEENLDRWPDGPVAVIHADGSGIGKKLIALGDDKNKLKAFSEAMKAACAESIVSAVNTLPCQDGLITARPIVSAGDDLTYIVPASRARAFAEAWLRAFELETDKRKKELGGKLCGGAGIVMLNRGYPFSQAYELAEQLCKAAKDQLKREGRDASIVAFKRVTTSLVDDLVQGTTGWVLSDADLLQDLVDVVRDLPRGVLRTWLDHFQRPSGEARAQQLWNRAKEVADPATWQRFSNALEAVGADPQTGQYRISSKESLALPLGTGRSTPVSDALTLRFIESKED